MATPASYDYEAALQTAYESFLRPGDVAIDVGAHRGRHALALAARVMPGGRLLAFEPIPALHAALRERLRSGHPEAGEAVRVLPFALGEASGRAELVDPDAPLGSEPLQVEVRTLDELTADLPAGRYLKVDVWSAELHALRGARALLRRLRPVVSFELRESSPRSHGVTPAETFQLLRSLEYDCFDLHGKELAGEARTWLAVPVEQRAVFERQIQPALDRFFAERDQEQDPARPYRSRVEAIDLQPPIRVAAGGVVRVRFQITNASPVPWTEQGIASRNGVLRLGLAWHRRHDGSPGSPQERVGEDRADLPLPLEPGAQATVAAALRPLATDGTPLPAGEYELRVSPVLEGVTWFSDQGDAPLRLAVTVEAVEAAGEAAAPGRRPAVHQFHAGSALGDAVTNSMLYAQQLLRQLGFESEIYVEHLAPELVGRLRPRRELEPEAGDVLLVHHSTGHAQLAWLRGLPGRKILVYHNVTPARFFAPGSTLHEHSVLGRQQLAELRPLCSAALAVSSFNAAELRELGYGRVEVLPLLRDPAAVREAPWKPLPPPEVDRFTLLFVGRLVENKRQHDLVELLAHLVAIHHRPCELVLAGAYSEQDPYLRRVREAVASRGLEGRVRLLGKVSDEELYAWYRRADAYVSVSAHEGFGVPLLEAMALDLPVVALASGAIPETLDRAGIQVTEPDLPSIAGVLSVLDSDRALRRAVIAGQRERVAAFSPQEVLSRLAAFLSSLDVPCQAPTPMTSGGPAPEVQIEGPFETSYSLAVVNRGLGLALERRWPGRVALFPTEGPGDYAPDAAAVEAWPGVAELWRRSRQGAAARVVIRNLYPPRVRDARGLVNLGFFFWEESAVPAEWVAELNRHLDGMVVASRFVRKVLLDSGVRLPIWVVGCGVEASAGEPPRASRSGTFRFLHVSSAFPRKGVDVLLEAYGRAFTSADPVRLVLKTFPNPHHRIEDQVQAALDRRRDFPRIELIDRDLPPAQLAELYRTCHALVAPSRGEGFGLPLAEAMLHGLPVVTTAAGGQADFCTPETSWPVRWRHAPAGSHFAQPDSTWFEPDPDDLARQLRAVYECPPEERRRRTARARARVSRDYGWDQVADRVLGAVDAIERRPPLEGRQRTLAWVSSWNTRCGIASYSRYLLSHLPARSFQTRILANRAAPEVPDDAAVTRCWDSAQVPGLQDLQRALDEARPDAVVIQLSFVFFPLQALGALLERLRAQGVPAVVFLHATADVNVPGFQASLRDIRGALEGVDRLLVHTLRDLERLRELGLTDNVALFPQGVISPSGRDRRTARAALGLPEDAEIVASYGFLLPHKGVEVLLRAFPEIRRARPRAKLLLANAIYPSPESEKLLASCRALAKELGVSEQVLFLNDFLPDDRSLLLLEASDLVALPYQQTGESASAALRMALASGRPVAVTPLPIFEDVGAAVHRLSGTSPADVARGLSELLADPEALARTSAPQAEWLRRHAWPLLARRLEGLLEGLIVNGRLRTGAPTVEEHRDATAVQS